jgi:hypothetical protein
MKYVTEMTPIFIPSYTGIVALTLTVHIVTAARTEPHKQQLPCSKQATTRGAVLYWMVANGQRLLMYPTFPTVGCMELVVQLSLIFFPPYATSPHVSVWKLPNGIAEGSYPAKYCYL